MKKVVWFIVLFFISGTVFASSGFLKGASIKTCGGITYGQHSSDNHWHVATKKEDRWYATGDPIYSDPCSSTSNNNSSENETKKEEKNEQQKEETKKEDSTKEESKKEETKKEDSTKEESKKDEVIESSDVSIKEMKIDQEKIEVSEKMKYETSMVISSIDIVLNDNKSSYEIIGDYKDLKSGSNYIIIKVIAEDKTEKNYELNIVYTPEEDKEEIVDSNPMIKLSNDTSIKVTINEEEVEFDKNNKVIVYFSNSETTLDFDYVLGNSNATVDITKLETIEVGDNIINIKVTAEDGSVQEYEINVYRYSKVEDIIYTVLGFGFLGGFGAGVVYLAKKAEKRPSK